MVQAGTLFGYLAAFITIVLALAVSDLALSLHRLIRARSRVRWHPLPLLAALFVLLVILTSFFEIWELTPLGRITYYRLAWLILPQIFYFLAASAVLPDDVPPGEFDLLAFYLRERVYIYSVLLTGTFLDFVGGLVADWAPHIRDLDTFLIHYLPLNLVSFAIMTALALSDRKRVHWLGLSALLVVAHLGFSTWAIEGAPATERAAARAR